MDAHTDNGRWTPQTQMLLAIEQWVRASPHEPRTALSIDRNDTLDALFRARWPELSTSVASYPQVDCQRLLMADNSFDLVYSNQVLEHVPRPWLAGEQIVRVLKPGGIGIHTTCTFNPRHGPPAFEDYYRFLPAGLAQLFPGVNVLELAEWGNAKAIAHNVTVNDGHGALGGRRFGPEIGSVSDGLYPWVVWIIFEKVTHAT